MVCGLLILVGIVVATFTWPAPSQMTVQQAVQSSGLLLVLAVLGASFDICRAVRRG
jgi:hypothetical protein